MHKIIKTEVVTLGPGVYGVRFTFDDGTEDLAEAGPLDAAEFYAPVQMGEVFPVGVNPMLLNAAKADELRRKARSRQRLAQNR